jgi:hypothetical protein
LKKICVYLRSSAVFNVKLLLWEHIGAGIYYFKIYKYVALYPLKVHKAAMNCGS